LITKGEGERGKEGGPLVRAAWGNGWWHVEGEGGITWRQPGKGVDERRRTIKDLDKKEEGGVNTSYYRAPKQ
jgi:hypothetical protein